MVYLELLWSFFQIGLFSIGGGYAAMPLIEHQVVELHPWLSPVQFGDIVAIAEMTPGPIAINCATFVGIQVAGLAGAVVATLGCVLPSIVIVLILAWAYYRYRSLSQLQGVLKGIKPAVVAMIASAGLSITVTALFAGGSAQPLYLGIFLAAFLALRLWKPSPILVMAASGALGLLGLVL